MRFIFDLGGLLKTYATARAAVGPSATKHGQPTLPFLPGRTAPGGC
jgi:hypothetical protein